MILLVRDSIIAGIVSNVDRISVPRNVRIKRL